MTMKVFVRTGDLSTDEPVVIATYSDESHVADSAHGDGMSVLTLPPDAVAMHDGMPHLRKDWRDRAGPMPVAAEAKRRVEREFPVDKQIDALRELIALILANGTESAKWPEGIRARMAEIDEQFRFIDEIKQRAKDHPVAPLDPGSDKLWPRRAART